MAKLRPFQTNLTRGELSQFIYSRPDLGAYQNGAEILENVIVLPEGGVRRRSGLRVVTEVKDSNRPTILIPHIRSQDLSYIVEAGAYYLRFYKGNVPIHDLAGAELITNGGFDTDLASWAVTGVAIWLPEGSALLVALGGGSFSELNQTIATATIGETYTAMFDVTFGPVDVYLTGSNKVYWQRFPLGHNVTNFVATSTTPGIIFRSADNAAVDNVSIKHNAAVIELSTPYADSELGLIHWIQSIDVLFMQHPNHGTAKLSNASDYQWTFALINFNPPPSIEDPPERHQPRRRRAYAFGHERHRRYAHRQPGVSLCRSGPQYYRVWRALSCAHYRLCRAAGHNGNHQRRRLADYDRTG